MANVVSRTTSYKRKHNGGTVPLKISANTQMDNDVTPVYLAAQEGHLEVLKFLVLEAGGSLYVRAKDGMAPVHAASQMGCLNCVKWMIQEQGVDPNLRDGDGATPLHFAASRGHLDTVRWLLKHGARLSLDKYGKSPINDAAENQQVECLNVLVQHGTTPDYQATSERISVGSRSCSCVVRKGEKVKRGNSAGSDCSMCKPKPPVNVDSFYLHPPLNDRVLEAPHAPENGLYINPMNKHRHSASSCSESSSSSVNGESFYLHNPQEVIYNRVKDLFGVNNASNTSTNERQPLSALTVKVEVHSSSSGAGSDENLSSSDLSERSGGGGEHENDYEDIYLVRDAGNPLPGEQQQHQQQQQKQEQRSGSRDSGSHSRSGSVSSSNSGCEVAVKKEPKYESIKKLENETAKPHEKPKLAARHSSPPMPDPSTQAQKRTTSGAEASPPPPPPPPPKAAPLQRFPGHEDDEPRGAEVVEIVEEPTLRPSDVVKGMCRSMSALSARRLNSSCSDLTIVSLGTAEEAEKYAGPNLVNKQRVLPFVPPSFPAADSNNLIKPSEYLRSIVSDKRDATTVRSAAEPPEEATQDKGVEVPGPPPPPLPDVPDMGESSPSQEAKKQSQPLSAISIQDLNSVQLRRTDKVIATKTFSAPTRSMSLQCLQSEPFLAQKIDLIAELKMSRGDISGIKKMKVEKAKTEESREKEIIMEISKQFTTTKFVEKVPEKDNTGNIIPAWKRQMLAKKAADKAKKELEEQLLKEAEEKRLQAIPQWKRQLLQKKEEAENKMRSTLYTPRVVDENKVNRVVLDNQKDDGKKDEVDNNNNDDSIKFEQSNDTEQSDEEPPNIIPWRAQLRKTNSKLNLLD